MQTSSWISYSVLQANLQYHDIDNQGRSQGGAEGAAAPPPLSLIERLSKDDTTPLTTPKRGIRSVGENDVEMP